MLLETPCACSLGLVIEHQEEPPAYLIRLPDGRVQGVLAGGECSSENVEGDIANPPTAPFIVAEEIPTWRLRAVASMAGLYDAITAALAALADPARTVATEIWHNGNTIRRDSALVAQLAAALGLSADQLDAYFISAGALPT